jgi:hypothetical protein
LSLAIVGEMGVATVVVVVSSVDVDCESVDVDVVVASVVLSVDVGAGSVDVEVASDDELSAAVDVLSVLSPARDVMPSAPETVAPAMNRTPSASTIAPRRHAFRPFISPAPLLPKIRRMKLTPLPVTTGPASPSRALPEWFARLSQARADPL